MKQIASGRVGTIVARYGEHAPTAAVCCNACRTCVTTNAVAIGVAAVAAAGAGLGRLVRRVGLIPAGRGTPPTGSPPA